MAPEIGKELRIRNVSECPKYPINHGDFFKRPVLDWNVEFGGQLPESRQNRPRINLFCRGARGIPLEEKWLGGPENAFKAKAALTNVLVKLQRFALRPCCNILAEGATKVYTGQAYGAYRNICENQGSRALTQRRFCDMISFLDLYGLISARVVSMSRYGKTRKIMSSLPDQIVQPFFSHCAP